MKITDMHVKTGDFSLDIQELFLEEGKIHGLIGANGSGKTTLAKVIMGLLPGGEHINYEHLKFEDMTMALQRPYLMHASVYENLIYPLKIRNQSIDRTKVGEWLRLCGLEEKEKQSARSLSSGERQKLSFVRALIFQPKLIILDETLSNLDLESTLKFEELILKRQKENPITWIIISHQPAQQLRLCEQVHFLSHGKWIESGATEKVLKESEHIEIRKYMDLQKVEVKL